MGDRDRSEFAEVLRLSHRRIRGWQEFIFCNTLAEWRRRLVGRPSQAVVARGDYTTAWEGRPTPFGERLTIFSTRENKPCRRESWG